MDNRYEELRDIILEWNEKINVTAIKDPAEFLEKNVNDSLSVCARSEYKTAQSVLDMGTGGGFPGLPLAIFSPEKRFVLVDAVGKKLKAVRDAAERLGLSNVTAIHARAEDMAREEEHREKYDLVLSRAVANMSTLCEYCLPFAKPGGYFIAYKTRDAGDEISAAERAVSVLGGRIADISPAAEGSGHVLVVVEKLSKTPPAYPRKAGIPGKDPLR